MFGSTPSGANAYAQVGVETGVVAASPLDEALRRPANVLVRATVGRAGVTTN